MLILLFSRAVYVARRSPSGWTPFRQVLAPDGVGADFFGSAVSIDEISSRLLIGSPLDDTPLVNAGSAYEWNVR